MTEARQLPTPSSLDFAAEMASPEWLARFVDAVPTGMALFDRELRYAAANALWAKGFRLGSAVVPGRWHHELECRGDTGGDAAFADLQRRALLGEIVNGCQSVEADAAGNLLHRAITARPWHGPGGVQGVIAAMHEIVTAAPDNGRDDLPDRLTGIAGRDRFLARLKSALAADAPIVGAGGGARGAAGGGVAAFLIDIDDFQSINDLYGTRVGDGVLRTIASRLLTGMRSAAAPAAASRGAGAREPDLVARLGADEFGIVLGGPPATMASAEAFARRLLRLVATPVVVGDQRIRLTANVGFVVTGATHRSEDDVLRDLHVALQEAKERGPNSAQAWEPALTSTAGRRLIMLNQLRRALEEGEFVLHYQPILRLADNRVVGAEALLRWNHPSEGLMPPNDFLPLLEESGLIVPVGCWVIREVVRQIEVWRTLYGRDMLEWVSVNVSARQFNDPALLLATLSEIDAGGFALERLKLEITESSVMRSPETTRAVLGQLQQLGIRVALDDFGTGYSALGALRHYAVDMIKIDRDFTSRLDSDHGRELMSALLKIARIHGALVVTEGVETEAQRAALRDSGCDFGQGYLFAKPMDGSVFGAYALTHLVAGAADD
ncbi:MAG: putative bifunctional diguanylate cyclase/phosphodiesterase [Thiohalocapsa sp.]